MAAFEDGKAITSGSSYTFTASMMAKDFKKLSSHSVNVTGVGSATINMVFPAGNKLAGSIGVAGSDVFYYPGVTGVRVTAVDDDIVVDFYSFVEGE